MLQEPADKLLRLQRHRPAGRFADPPVPEDNPTVVDRDDPAVGDGDTMHVPSEVIEHTIGPLDRGLAVHDPALLPD